jgi:hypothetical protein
MYCDIYASAARLRSIQSEEDSESSNSSRPFFTRPCAHITPIQTYSSEILSHIYDPSTGGTGQSHFGPVGRETCHTLSPNNQKYQITDWPHLGYQSQYLQTTLDPSKGDDPHTWICVLYTQKQPDLALTSFRSEGQCN